MFIFAEISNVFSSQLPGWPARVERSRCSLNEGSYWSWAVWSDIAMTGKGGSRVGVLTLLAIIL